MLIVFEGIDGSGKNTQIAKLMAFLRQNGVKVKLHKYPTKKAKGAFAHLAGKKTVPPAALAEIFANDIVDEKRKFSKEIDDGYVVICDRYVHSTLAYQGVGAGFAKIRAMIEKKDPIVPDLVILLDVTSALSVKRKSAQKKLDRFEKDSPFLAKVRKNYLQMTRKGFCAYKYAVVDASKPADEVFTDVITLVEPLVTKRIEK